MGDEIEKLKEIINKYGFTWQEAKIILFLSSVLIAGTIIHLIREAGEDDNKKQFDYSKSDSIFLGGKNKINETKINDKKVDSEPELLDFSTNKLSKEKDKTVEKSNAKVNLNTADLEILISLPGIGEKTAESIILLRKKKGKFSRVDELLEIKGIGQAKLAKLKEFLIIE